MHAARVLRRCGFSWKQWNILLYAGGVYSIFVIQFSLPATTRHSLAAQFPEFAASTLTWNSVFAIQSVTRFCTAVPAGLIIDRYGRRGPIMYTFLGGIAASVLGSLLSFDNIYCYMAWRAVITLLGAPSSVSAGILAIECVGTQHRALIFFLAQALCGLCSVAILGSAMGQENGLASGEPGLKELWALMQRYCHLPMLAFAVVGFFNFVESPLWLLVKRKPRYQVWQAFSSLNSSGLPLAKLLKVRSLDDVLFKHIDDVDPTRLKHEGYLCTCPPLRPVPLRVRNLDPPPDSRRVSLYATLEQARRALQKYRKGSMLREPASREATKVASSPLSARTHHFDMEGSSVYTESESEDTDGGEEHIPAPSVIFTHQLTHTTQTLPERGMVDDSAPNALYCSLEFNNLSSTDAPPPSPTAALPRASGHWPRLGRVPPPSPAYFERRAGALGPMPLPLGGTSGQLLPCESRSEIPTPNEHYLDYSKTAPLTPPSMCNVAAERRREMAATAPGLYNHMQSHVAWREDYGGSVRSSELPLKWRSDTRAEFLWPWYVLTRKPWSSVTGTLAAVWFLSAWSYWGLLTYYEQFFSAVGVDVNLVTMLSYAVQMPFHLISYEIMKAPWGGRKTAIRVTALVGGVVCAILAFAIGSGTSNVLGLSTLAILTVALGTALWGPIFSYSAERYPTELRGTAMGIFSAVNGLSTLATSYVGSASYPSSAIWLMPLFWGLARFGVYVAVYQLDVELLDEDFSDERSHCYYFFQ